MKLLDKNRKESFKSLTNQRDILRITKDRLKSEITFQSIVATAGEAQARLFKDRAELVSKLGLLERTVLFRGEKENIEAFKLRQLQHRTDILNLDEEIKALDERRKALIRTGKDGKRAGVVPGAITGPTTTITSAAPKTFNVIIEKLVETINISPATLREGTAEIKKQLTEAFLTVLADVQLQVR